MPLLVAAPWPDERGRAPWGQLVAAWPISAPVLGAVACSCVVQLSGLHVDGWGLDDAAHYETSQRGPL